jgi:hypothetical protein
MEALDFYVEATLHLSLPHTYRILLFNIPAEE